MNKQLRAAIALSLSALAGVAGAQGIYRCGDSYSQKPCAGGRLVETEDARSAAQRSQTAQAALRDAKAADAMEQARLKEEAKPAQVYIPAAKAADTAKTTSALKKPAEFKASAPAKPGEIPKTTKKKAAKKQSQPKKAA
jgi:hypothetical protein